MKNISRRLFFILSMLIAVVGITKANLKIPEPLMPWKEWVLYGQDDALCPTPYNNGEVHVCDWPSNITLIIDEQKGQFLQKGTNHKLGWVMLPGDAEHWPMDIKVNDKAFPVEAHDGVPAVFLDKGEYNIQGQFTWKNRPDTIQIPPTTGLVNLTLAGKQIDQPEREGEKIWLNTSSISHEKEDALTIMVFRLIQDQIPMRDHTHIQLKVTGQVREINIGPVILPQTLPVQISSPLPVRLEENGILSLQVKPGTWDIDVQSRFVGDQKKIAWIEHPLPWPKEEIWSFQPQSELRLVDIQGVASLDPQQTQMPAHWKKFPAFLMHAHSVFNIVEKHRGQEKFRYEQVNIQRQMWLDFSGKGFITQDVLSGNLKSEWRLSVLPPYQLGRVTIADQDQLITTLVPDGQPGVEIRQGDLQLTAVSRVEKAPIHLPAVGWDIDVQSLSTALYLPPGWQLLAAWGADTASNAWFQAWTLLDLFLICIMVIATVKLLNLRWGVVVLLMLVMTYQEKGAPIYTWLNLIVAFALYKVMIHEKARTFFTYYFSVSFILLGIIALPFMVKQIREAVYPQLSIPNIISPDRSATQIQEAARTMLAPSPASLGTMKAYSGKARSMLQQNAMEPKEVMPTNTEHAYDPNAKIQTGPGVPQWYWNVYQLNWNGPVLKDQQMRLWLIPGWMNSCLKVLQVILMSLFIFAISLPWRMKKKDFNKSASAFVMVISLVSLGLILSALSLPSTAYADFPDKNLLADLRERLLEPPECLPECALISRMQVEINQEQLTLRGWVNVAEKTSIPLPIAPKKWMPRTVLVDNKVATGLQFDAEQRLWLLLEPGIHDIVLEAPIGGQASFDLSFPLKPKSITVTANGWEITGMREHQLQGQNLYFSRIQEGATSSPDSFQTNRIPPFVVLSRKFNLGLDWEVINELSRIAPQQGAIPVMIPLLPGELVLSDLVEVKENKVIAVLGADQKKLSWRSRLAPVSRMILEAVDNPSVKEIWQLDAISQWHCTFSGIPMIHQINPQGHWYPTWEPWPLEKLSIDITRPEAVPGDTLTIENSQVKVIPSKRSTFNNLQFSLRSSQGGMHTVSLPKDAQLQDVLINGLSQPINSSLGEIVLPIHPGAQQIEVKWQIPTGIATFWVTPTIDLKMPSSNAIIDVALSKDRWILALGGPLIGPAVLFWGVLFVVILASIALGKSTLTPLNITQWFLLGIGLSLATPFALICIVVWFIAMSKRKQMDVNNHSVMAFQLKQIGLVILTFLFVVSLFISISEGLLGTPHMQLGDPKTALVFSRFDLPALFQLQWYQDMTTNGMLPKAWVFNLPLYVYRLLMLFWALWLAISLVKWLQWSWQCFSAGALWRKRPVIKT